MMASTAVLAACSKDNKDQDPGTQPDEPITNVYEASTLKIEMKNPVTGEWKTLSNKTNPRRLAHEFAWEGDRLESVTDHNTTVFYSFDYDKEGRIVHIYSDKDLDYSRSLTYDEEGQLSLSKGTIRQGDGKLLASQDFVFTWANGVLQKVEEETWSHYPDDEEINQTVTRTYTWEGGNVVKTLRHVVKNGKTLTDTEYTYEYSTFLNPLHGFVLSMHPERGIIFDFEGIDGLSKNLPSRVVSSLNNRYEYSYTGSDRVTSIEKHEIADGSDMLHQYVDYTLDLEYVRLK